MVKTREVVRKIAQEARRQGIEWVMAREGANHTIFSLGGLMIPIVRHRETDDRLARKVFEEREPSWERGGGGDHLSRPRGAWRAVLAGSRVRARSVDAGSHAT